MSWQTDMVTMLRVIINDMDCQLFTDSRLQQLLVVSAQLVNQEMDFNVNYTISISDFSITPDSTLPDSRDDVFTNFVVMKAACISDIGATRTASVISNLNIKCGPVSIGTGSYSAAFEKLLTVGPCAAYQEMKKAYEYGDVGVVRVILSPFVGNQFDPQDLHLGHNDYSYRLRERR